jgi:hypothetical protein
MVMPVLTDFMCAVTEEEEVAFTDILKSEHSLVMALGGNPMSSEN